jgi:hypothetical protein
MKLALSLCYKQASAAGRRLSGAQGQGVGGQFMPMGKHAPHLPSQQYSPTLHDLVPHATTPVSGRETEASDPLPCPLSPEPDANRFADASSDPQPASANTKPAQIIVRIAITRAVKVALNVVE